DLVYDEMFTEEAVAGIGSIIEGQKYGNEAIVLYFSSFEDNQRFVDIFNKDLKANNWTIKSEQAWLNFSKNAGTVNTEERILISVDWNKAKAEENKASFTVSDDQGNSQTYAVVATKFDFKLTKNAYAEGNGFVSIEAENYSAKHNADASWLRYEDFGYAKASMFLKGGDKVDAAIKDTENLEKAARLEYKVYFATAGTHYAELYRIPTLNEGKGKTVQVAIGLNDEAPQVLNGVRKKKEFKSVTLSDGTTHGWRWENNVLMQMERLPFEITVAEPGYHTLKVYQVDTDIGFDKLVITTNEQAKLAQQDALIGAPESYNTIAKYQSVVPAMPPKLDGLAELTPYREQPALSDVNLNFAFYAMINAFDFIAVNQRHVYNPNKNQFGWRAEDVDYINLEHNEETHRIPFWQRDALRGEKESKFYVKLEEGRYDISYYMGDARLPEEMIYNIGKNYRMSFSINGKQLMDKVDVISGTQVIDTVEVDIAEGELLELSLSGKWIINALVIKKK
ncbi:hypothetical protein, partial [Agaribacterium haliotis]|uniref:hypothetical protein n=1 Tax=Agaribacterium haliotis TaxID=2013869 RepID=UPI00195CFD34